MTREAIWCLTLLGVFQVLAGAKLPPCLQKSKGSFEEPGSDAAPDLLFTQQAHEAILEVLIADEIYADLGATLTLVGVAPTTTWFTDRPNRKAGHVATGLLTSSPVFFKETEFGSDELAWLGAPNALLTGVVVEGDGDGSPAPASAVMTLYDPDYDLQSRTLKYKVTLIPKGDPSEGKLAEGGLSTYALEEPDSGLKPAPLHKFTGDSRNVTWRFPALFIDDYLAELPGTCTYQRFMAGNCTCPATRSDTYCGTDLGTVGQNPVAGAQFGVWGSNYGGSTLEGYNQFSVPNGYLYKSYYG